MIVDVDAHIDVDLKVLAPFVEQPWRGHIEWGNLSYFLPEQLGDAYVAGRIRRPLDAHEAPRFAADRRVVFPTQFLPLSLHPNPGTESALARGYARWLTEAYLPQHPGAGGMLYLPLADVEAARAVVAAFGERRGVVGCFVTNTGFLPLDDNRFAPLWADLQERGLVLGFHPVATWQERPFDIFDRFLPVWAVGYPLTQCVHLISWVLGGMPERFPRLRCVFYEAGISWLTFVAHRVDGEFLKRPSEAPLLRERPSHYLRRMYFCTQPLDQAREPAHLEAPMRLVGTDRLLFGSNYPQWDFDRPEVLERLPFLHAAEREAILSGNALNVFGLPPQEGLPAG